MKEKASTINIIWLSIILISIASAAWLGKMSALTLALFEESKAAVMLAVGLIGSMAFWLGMMKILEEAGALRIIAKIVRPVMSKLFPEIPKDHPAIGAIVMNMSANMLGMGNAATPFGINAMQELDKLNGEKGRATNAMCLFLAINTSSVTLLPLGVITIRAAAGAKDPASILIPSLLATIVSTTVAILATKLLQRRTPDCAASEIQTEIEEKQPEVAEEKASVWKKIVVSVFMLAILAGMGYQIASSDLSNITFTGVTNAVSDWLVPMIVVIILIFGYLKNVKIYETLCSGAKEGFNTAVRIIPFMVAIFAAVGMFKASGAMDIMIRLLNPVTNLVGMPAEALPMALMRPLSGSGAFGIMSQIVGSEPDSFLSFLVSVMQGSTETTFYVLALYFGAVSIKNSRHALPAALCADFAGIMAAVLFCHLFW
ncbi:spore maturation protein [bacterium]|nr:spore maturation protein [bacterium]